MPGPQIWNLVASTPSIAVKWAKHAEASGMAGLLVTDSQNMAGDCYVGLAAAAMATTRIGLGTGVTNPVTRHPAVTAAAIASIQKLSDGRAVLGIGRGDSSLAHLGKAPASLETLRRYTIALQRYLRGETIPFDELGFHEHLAPSVDTLRLADVPDGSRLLWTKGLAKVPVEVVATGPKAIAIAAIEADTVLLAVGADEERLRWGIDVARSARAAVGLDPMAIQIGAYINIAAHPSLPTARRLVEGGLASFARFSVMHGTPTGPQNDESTQALKALHSTYDMNKHTRATTSHAGVLDDAFIDRYAVVGSAGQVTEKLLAIEALGVDKVLMVGPGAGNDPAEAALARDLFAAAVLPQLV
jgi:5,10-methylenetetrahydromethanopterin reductase